MLDIEERVKNAQMEPLLTIMADPNQTKLPNGQGLFVGSVKLEDQYVNKSIKEKVQVIRGLMCLIGNMAGQVLYGDFIDEGHPASEWDSQIVPEILFRGFMPDLCAAAIEGAESASKSNEAELDQALSKIINVVPRPTHE